MVSKYETYKSTLDLLAKVKGELEEALARQSASDTVLGWSNGLAVAVRDGRPVIVGADTADAISDDVGTPDFRDGMGIAAQRYKRKELLRLSVARIVTLMYLFRYQMFDEAP